MLRTPLATVVVVLARAVRWGFYRRVETVGRDRIPNDGPMLIVANHYNGLIDAVLVVASLGRLPRFVAKSTLGDNPAVRLALRALGVVLVRRPEDRSTGSPGSTGGGAPANAAMFAETSAALAAGHTVVIFPEGTTHDRPSLARIRTGAARMALLADHAGAHDVLIVPMGITYHDKISVRSSALVTVGDPISVRDAVAADPTTPAVDADGPDPATVDALTAQIDTRLRRVSPDYEDGIDWASAELAADLYLRTDARRSPAFDSRDGVVRRLRELPADARDAALDIVSTYVLALTATGVDDDLVLGADTFRRSFRPLVIAAVVLTVLSPLSTFGLTVNAIPVVLTMASGLATTKPFMKGTFRALTALLTFPVAWITAAVVLADPFWTQVGIVALCIVGLVVVVAAIESAILLVEAALDWRRSLERRVPIQALRDRRATMVTEFERALG